MGQISLQIPVANQPNTSEDPKVASDFTTLQTLLNGNIDSTNLSATAGITRSQQAGGGGNLAVASASANTSATDGHLYLVTAGNVTITLPSPAAGVTVGVFAASNSITGSAPVTVATPTGDISGVGVFATSITLGTTNSFVVLLGDGGGGYRIISGQRDTGWVPLTLPAGVTSAGVTPAARLIGDIVRLQGSAQTSATIAIGGTVATVPAAMVPAATKSAVGWASNGAMSMLVGSGTGAISFGFAWSSAYTAEFGGVTYALN